MDSTFGGHLPLNRVLIYHHDQTTIRNLHLPVDSVIQQHIVALRDFDEISLYKKRQLTSLILIFFVH
jgi:hypothetical protein